MIDQTTLKSIEDLHRLKTDGIITEEEFERSKQKILFGGGGRAAATTGTSLAPTGHTYEGTLPAFEDVAGWLKLPFLRYNDFAGRSGRREFWLFQLIPAAVVAAFMWIYRQTEAAGDMTSFQSAVTLLTELAMLGLLVPQIALQVRRFHDQDRSGWFVAINLVPYVGFIIVAVMMLLEGTRGDNRYGPDPKSA